jgi:hypothetical protein
MVEVRYTNHRSGKQAVHYRMPDNDPNLESIRKIIQYQTENFGRSLYSICEAASSSTPQKSCLRCGSHPCRVWGEARWDLGSQEYPAVHALAVTTAFQCPFFRER